MTIYEAEQVIRSDKHKSPDGFITEQGEEAYIVIEHAIKDGYTIVDGKPKSFTQFMHEAYRRF